MNYNRGSHKSSGKKHWGTYIATCSKYQIRAIFDDITNRFYSCKKKFETPFYKFKRFCTWHCSNIYTQKIKNFVFCNFPFKIVRITDIKNFFCIRFFLQCKTYCDSRINVSTSTATGDKIRIFLSSFFHIVLSSLFFFLKYSTKFPPYTMKQSKMYHQNL